MWEMKTRIAFVILIQICRHFSLFSCQEINRPRGPWQLAFKVVSGNWNSTATGYSSFWGLFTSTDTYNTASPVPDQRDFSTSSNNYKSELVQQWEEGYISVQAIKLSFFKNNKEKAYVVFNAIGKTKTTWFKCDNILYSSYTDLPDNTLPTECPGKNAMGLPLTMMKVSYFFAICPDTTGWLVVADNDFSFSLCPNYMPADGSEPKPYFKFSSLTTVADLSTQLETADSIGIFFQVWDMAFKGVEGIKPSAVGLNNLTGLFMLDITENDNSDLTVRNLKHSQSSQIFKSDVINLWDTYYIDMVKFSMSKSGVEKAYVVFDGVNTDKLSWFSESNILYSSYGSSLDGASLEMCSIEGDENRNWQIQSLADESGCSSSEQQGWMLVKEPKNNGTCSWDTSAIKKKPFFLYNAAPSAANPSTFQYADVIAVFVHGWRMVLKVAAGGSVSPKSSVYSLWSETGSVNEDVSGAASLASGTTYKSSVIDQWTSFYIRAVKIAAYKDGLEVFNAVFDATGSSNTDWLDCARLLYTSVSGLTSITTSTNSYTCSFQGDSSTFRFLLGKSPDCGSVSATGVFFIVDADSTCSSRNDLPQFLFSNTLDTSLTDMTESQLADTFAVFVDMANCYTDTCLNGATCQDLGGNFRCFCTGNYYGDTCADFDGTYGDWSTWSECSVTCANGTQSRNRTCIGTEGDGICAGESSETITCSLDPCPIDGGYTDWTEWSACSVTCGDGVRTRSRECTNPPPEFGGAPCDGAAVETMLCTEGCPDRRRAAPSVNGGFTEWTTWTDCSVTCGDGDQTRTRTCTNPEPQNGGTGCAGDTQESQTCNVASCPPEMIDGGFAEWTPWTECSLSCGGGQQTRTRTCSNPEPQNGGSDCIGDTEESRTCNTESCQPVDGGFSEWSSWTECSVPCGDGDRTRTRACTNPEPQNGGNECVGDTQESQNCNLANCPVDGGFSELGVWSDCSKTCDTGEKTRSRECNNPSPLYGGSDCVGNTSEAVVCNTDPCPGTEGFSSWSAWDACTVSCGTGTTSRTRVCDNSEDGCIGDLVETKDCNIQPCPINGGFTEWSVWGDCSVTCGNGTQSRARNCSDPEPQNGGEDCVGQVEEIETCSLDPCPVDGYWSNWEDWSTCSASCDSGTRERTRTCVEPLNGGKPCEGAGQQVEFCNIKACPLDGVWSEWTAWEDCNATCEGGIRIRTRTCIGPLHGGEECNGTSEETEICNTDPCPINGYWSNWNEWTTCTLTCNTGTRERMRTCVDPQNGGKTCTGAAVQTEFCNTELCPVDGTWLNWSEWDTCTASCGGGSRNRSRTCVEPMHGGNDCVGDETETDVCNEEPCPVNGIWLNWIAWGSCSVSCSDGTRNRSRLCLGPLHGGLDCVGENWESESCNNGNCPINGYWSEWSEWTKCSATCGGGYRNKSRSCNEPLYGGLMCQGEMSETGTCNVDACPIDGEWSDWSQWSTCTDTCGGGTREKTRTCSEPKYGGKFCVGEASETNMCNVEPCPVDGYWEEWSEWTECSVVCAGGSRNRTRACVEPKFGGRECIGKDAETEECNRQKCPVDGVWTTWSQWSECSSTCNGGARNRSRSCTEPRFGGETCSGRDIDIQICGMEACPSVDGGWASWTGWTACSMTCGFAERTRNRSCTNPSPMWGGKYCEGIHIQSDSCKVNDCPVDGEWTEWTSWTPCFNMTANGFLNPKCGRGFKERNRTCDNPAPQFEGRDCAGDSEEVISCNVPCHTITCSKEHPENCQIIFQNIPQSKGLVISASTSAAIFILLHTIRLYI